MPILDFRFLACVCLLLSGIGAQAAPRPAVVELFTSEGCSSCPPAELYLGELAKRRDVLALAFHVDYWDDLGWRDRFDIPEATPRQRAYAKALQLSSVYTPQVVIDGRSNFVGSDRQNIGKSLNASRSGIPIAISTHEDAILIDVSDQPGSAPSEVLLVAYQRSAVSAIGRGENSGRTLTEFNIVRSVQRLGNFTGSAQHYQAGISALPKDATDVAVLVQTSNQGPILAAAAIALR